LDVEYTNAPDAHFFFFSFTFYCPHKYLIKQLRIAKYANNSRKWKNANVPYGTMVAFVPMEEFFV